MKKRNISIGILSTICFILLMAPVASIATTPITLVGEVNDSYQIVDSNGEVYDIADTAEGNDLADQHIGEKVRVTGTIEQDEETKFILVTDYEMLAK